MATIEIDGKTVEVEAGAMVIEAADQAGIVIPRFCYHKKLSVAANCRMCLVEIENGRKPMPACATPVTEGMKVYTKSKMALDAQKAVMEFLLVNHPLDCPICDQGGECELQDVSMGYGKDISNYTEAKRSVSDDDLGPLIATEMTRCIHCTRCVRFGQEVAGFREMGATGRGEHTQIGTYVKHSISSEVSGNIIDLCPVGALTSKPSRFNARPWELTQHEQVASHDCLGSNTVVHVRRNEVMRVVPKDNESINETWLSDRDRFSYTAAQAKDRLSNPMIKKDGTWHEVDWQSALNHVLAGFNKLLNKHGPESIAGICSPSATVEEAYLFQKFLRSMDVQNIDHRIHQVDFKDQEYLPMAPISNRAIAEIEQDDLIFLLGSNIQQEQPLLGLRVRKAQLHGTKVISLSAEDYDFNFVVESNLVTSPSGVVSELAAIVKSLQEECSIELAEGISLLEKVNVSETSKLFARALKEGKRATILMGALVHNHPQASTIRSLVHLIQKLVDVNIYRLTEGCNEAGCHIAGVLPHQGPCGEQLSQKGLDHQQAFKNRLAGFLIHNVEAELDVANPQNARQALLGAEFVAVVTSYKSESMFDYADVLLPASLPFETSGTYVNCVGNWQSFKGAVTSYENSRPAWKIYRVLGNIFEFSGFDYSDSLQVLEELKSKYNIATPIQADWYQPEDDLQVEQVLQRVGDWSIYRMDSMLRHAQPLQESATNRQPAIRLNSKLAKKYELTKTATVSQGDIEITLPLIIDDRLPDNAVYVASGWPETSDLGGIYDPIDLKA